MRFVVPEFIIAPEAGAGSYTETVDLVIPDGAPMGMHRMRAKTNWQAEVPNDACEETTVWRKQRIIQQILVL